MKIKFNGNPWNYWAMTLGSSLLVGITLGLAMPFFVYWQFKWFAESIELIKQA